jgi:hypothetical protein
MLGLAFTPTPLTGASGREKWPAIREGSRDAVHYLGDRIHDKSKRK